VEENEPVYIELADVLKDVEMSVAMHLPAPVAPAEHFGHLRVAFHDRRRRPV